LASFAVVTHFCAGIALLAPLALFIFSFLLIFFSLSLPLSLSHTKVPLGTMTAMVLPRALTVVVSAQVLAEFKASPAYASVESPASVSAPAKAAASAEASGAASVETVVAEAGSAKCAVDKAATGATGSAVATF